MSTQDRLMHWVVFTDSVRAPRPSFASDYSSPAEHPISLGPVGWVVRRDGGGLAPPPSALEMMEEGTRVGEEDREAMRKLAAEWRERIAAGEVQAAEADPESLKRFQEHHATQLASNLGYED